MLGPKDKSPKAYYDEWTDDNNTGTGGGHPYYDDDWDDDYSSGENWGHPYYD